jgi:hypothetical protein
LHGARPESTISRSVALVLVRSSLYDKHLAKLASRPAFRVTIDKPKRPLVYWTGTLALEPAK